MNMNDPDGIRGKEDKKRTVKKDEDEPLRRITELCRGRKVNRRPAKAFRRWKCQDPGTEGPREVEDR